MFGGFFFFPPIGTYNDVKILKTSHDYKTQSGKIEMQVQDYLTLLVYVCIAIICVALLVAGGTYRVPTIPPPTSPHSKAGDNNHAGASFNSPPAPANSLVAGDKVQCLPVNEDVYNPKYKADFKSPPWPCCPPLQPSTQSNGQVRCMPLTEATTCLSANEDVYDPKYRKDFPRPPWPCCPSLQATTQSNGQVRCVQANKTGVVSVGSLNVHIETDGSWKQSRASIVREILLGMNCDVLCLQEVSESMLYDIFNGSQYRTIALGTNGVQRNYEGVATDMVPVVAPMQPCSSLDPTSPCCLYKTSKCHLDGKPRIDQWCASDSSQPIKKNVGYRILYKNTAISLVGGGRKQFVTQGGCPIWDSQRYFEYAKFRTRASGVEFYVFAPHMSQSKPEKSTSAGGEGWGNTANISQQKEMYRSAVGIAGGLPFIIAGDMNDKQRFWYSQRDVKVDANPDTKEIDYIVSSDTLTVKGVPVYTETKTGSDHPYALMVTYVM